MLEPLPVKLLAYEDRYGLLHPDNHDELKDGYGWVQVGPDGPFEQFLLVEMEPTTWDDFTDWLNRQ